MSFLKQKPLDLIIPWSAKVQNSFWYGDGTPKRWFRKIWFLSHESGFMEMVSIQTPSLPNIQRFFHSKSNNKEVIRSV